MHNGHLPGIELDTGAKDRTTLPVRWFVRGRIRSVCGCPLILDGAPMAYDVEFILSSVHAIQKRHGVVSAQPALPLHGVRE